MNFLLGHDPPRWRHGAGGCHWRDRERQPRIPSRRPIGRIEFAIPFQVQISLHVSHREQISDLRADTDNARPKSTQGRVLAKIVGDLLVRISDKADENLFREKLRSTPIDVKIDAVLVLRVLVLEIVGKARDS